MKKIIFLFIVPVKLTNVSGNLTVREGSNATLFCEAAGRPQPDIVLARILEDGSVEELEQGRAIAWDFLNIRRTVSGIYKYRCAADNGYTSDSKVFMVNVTCKYLHHIHVSRLFIQVKVSNSKFLD